MMIVVLIVSIYEIFLEAHSHAYKKKESDFIEQNSTAVNKRWKKCTTHSSIFKTKDEHYISESNISSLTQST